MERPSKPLFLAGVFLITFAGLVFQIVQTRVLSVLAWYYLAFFAISVAMLGMTIGAVWVHLRSDKFPPERFSTTLADFALLSALAMPGSLAIQFSLITTMTPTLSTVFAWVILLLAMALPYVFSGVVVSVALTRSPFPINQVYGIDLLGAALGCVAVIFLLNVLDGPSAIILAGAIAALGAWCFVAATSASERAHVGHRNWLRRDPAIVALLLLAWALVNGRTSSGLRALMVKGNIESYRGLVEKWNSYSRIVAYPPNQSPPGLWGPAPNEPITSPVPNALLQIDGAASTTMFHYDGTPKSIDFLRTDIVNLAYALPDIKRSAVIGIGGGRDLMAAHLFGVADITGVELNPIFVYLHTRDPFFRPFSNLLAIPGLHLHIDDARNWFASTNERFDLIQMSMIDTWAATGAGAFSLSENGLYTLEGWRAFLGALTDHGVFTVSRWYNPTDVNETGRMIGLATAAVLDLGVRDARPQIFVARADHIATLVLAKRPFTADDLRVLRHEVERLGFGVLVDPAAPAGSPLLAAMTAAPDIATLNRAADSASLDLTVPTDNRPFFFNQLRFVDVPRVARQMLRESSDGGSIATGVLNGNLIASMTLALILFISIIAVICTIVLPLRASVRRAPAALIRAGTLYFSLIGIGFMLAEISTLQYFSIYLGHPIYSLGVCLFSLILSSGLGSLASNRVSIRTPGAMALWGALAGGYLLALPHWLPALFQATTADRLALRIVIALAVIMPFGGLLGFAFPTGMRLVEAVDEEPTAWFWGINGATGVLASVLAVMISMAAGIGATTTIGGLCYLAIIPVGRALIAMRPSAQMPPASSPVR